MKTLVRRVLQIRTILQTIRGRKRTKKKTVPNLEKKFADKLYNMNLKYRVTSKRL